MSLPTLYGLDSKGKIKIWFVSVYGDTITVNYGQDGGKIQTQDTVCKGKNIGRSNATTGYEQARLEAKSKWNKQIKKGLVEDKDNIPTNTLPPLAKKYQNAGHQLSWPADCLVKLDGVRCTMFYKGNGEVFFQSRGGDPYPVIEDIAGELMEKIFNEFPNYVVDCEIYNHGMFLEDITGAVKKHNKNTPKLLARVFDMFDPARPNMTWIARYEMYIGILKGTRAAGDRVLPIEAETIHSEKEMIELHDDFVDLRYEGVVIRELDGIFEFDQRSSHFQKYKIPISDEFMVVDIVEDKNGCGVPVCITHVNGIQKEFKAPLAATHERRKEILDNKFHYITEWLIVDFEKLSKYGIPTKPIGKAFRDMDEDGKVLN